MKYAAEVKRLHQVKNDLADLIEEVAALTKIIDGANDDDDIPDFMVKMVKSLIGMDEYVLKSLGAEMPDPPETYEMVVLSTAHLSPEDASAMEKKDNFLPFVTYRGEYGWLVNVKAESLNDKAMLSQWTSLGSVVEYAKENFFDYVMFDADGPTVEDLTKYEW